MSNTQFKCLLFLVMALLGCADTDELRKEEEAKSKCALSQPGVIYGTYIDYRGETYKTVVIGTQTWMARNLNYAADGSECNDCATYGRLYNWTTAMTVCPSGWHLPSSDEWTTLTDFAGSSTAGKKLKATSGWDFGNGTDDYGFSALPGGNGNSGGSFTTVGSYGNWWSATEYNATNAYSWSILSSSAYVNGYDGKTYLLSVRCLQD